MAPMVQEKQYYKNHERILYPDGGECIIDGLVPYKNRREHVRTLVLYLVSVLSYGGMSCY